MTGRLAVPPAGIPRPPRRAQYSSTCDERPFAVWLMFGVIGIPIRRGPDLNALEFGLLTSTPMLTGALFRLPLGIWTDRFGGGGSACFCC
jgi:NNP family nitrate/nitrite transporter-like MFS transporter